MHPHNHPASSPPTHPSPLPAQVSASRLVGADEDGALLAGGDAGPATQAVAEVAKAKVGPSRLIELGAVGWWRRCAAIDDQEFRQAIDSVGALQPPSTPPPPCTPSSRASW